MFFSHQGLHPEKGRFRLGREVAATGHSGLCAPVFARLFHGFAYRTATLTVQKTDDCVFRIGQGVPPSADGVAYAIRVEAAGAAVCAATPADLVRGVLTLFDLICMDEQGGCYLPFCDFRESPQVTVRMVHFCVFPETELWEFKRFIYLCGALKYTHLVLEFWGMLQFSCLRELAWPQGYTKAQIAPLIREAQALGMEVVPMFNHWGHASLSRVAFGKHTVLDQNPALQYLFEEGGWCWNLENAATRYLLREVREEWMELCGPGTYFHIGCDEPYQTDITSAGRERICRFLLQTADELATAGRTPILWGDMLLYPQPEYVHGSSYCTTAPNREWAAALTRALSGRVTVADWQYSVRYSPVETALTLKKAGFPVLLCPWDRSEACTDACLHTVKEAGLTGILHTTWHTLSTGLPYVGRVAAGCFSVGENRSTGIGSGEEMRVRTAALLRRVAFADGVYTHAGFSPHQTGEGLD